VLALTNEPHVPLAVAAPQVPETLSRLVDALLAKDPAQRPASAKEVVKEFEADRSKAARRGAAGIHGDCDQRYEQHLGGARDRRARQHGGAQFADRVPSERPVWPWVAGAVALAAVVLIIALASSGGKHPPASAADVPKRSSPSKPPASPKRWSIRSPRYSTADQAVATPSAVARHRRMIAANAVACGITPSHASITRCLT